MKKILMFPFALLMAILTYIDWYSKKGGLPPRH